MELASNTISENIKNEQCQKESGGAEAGLSMTGLSMMAHRQNEIPEAFQDVKSSSGGTSVEVVMEKLKAGNVKEKQSNDDRLSLKRKLESEEKPAVRKDPPESQPINIFLSHIPLKTLMEVETKLVYVDEEEVTYEFGGAQVPTSGLPKCPEAVYIDPLRTPDGHQPQMDKWLQVALKDASTCYKQKKYAVAAGQFRTALEVGEKVW